MYQIEVVLKSGKTHVVLSETPSSDMDLSYNMQAGETILKVGYPSAIFHWAEVEALKSKELAQ